MSASGESEAGDAGLVERARTALGALDEVFPEVEQLYMDLHRHPELSLQEERTAARAAEWLERAGYEVTTGVGGHGVVGLLRNGEGPTILLRGDMDALPVEEKTDLPYASTAMATDPEGRVVPVCHACGHDAHTSCLVGAAGLLARARQLWQGTVMAVAQPAEEVFVGARAMLGDGLYRRFGRPDVVLGQHVLPFPTGVVLHREGPVMAAAVTLAIRVAGRGGHGSAPHKAVDPVVTAAYIVTRLQSIVSREVDPADPAVVTVGMLQAGTAGNVIPDEARMAVNVRSYDDDVQRHLLEAIDRVVKAEALAGRSPAEPEVATISHTRVTSNDARSMKRVRAAHEAYFGTDRVVELPRLMGSEDFGEFGLPGEGDGATEIPCVFWGVGCTDAETWRRGHVAFNHSPFFRVERVPTLRTALEGMTVAALAFLAG